MTDWATLADVGTAAGTLILAGATFVAVRAAARSCDATRYWSLPPGRPLRDLGFS